MTWLDFVGQGQGH